MNKSIGTGFKLNSYSLQVFIGFNLFLLSTLLSIVFFDPFGYDFIAYHGPFSAKELNIEAISNIKLDSILESRRLGFPSLWRYLIYPGITLGAPRLILLSNAAALLFFCFTTKRILKLPQLFTYLLVLSYPIVLFNFRSGYQDFFVACLVSGGFLMLLNAVYSESKRQVVYSSIPLALAAFTKYQGFFQAFLVLTVGCLFYLLLKLTLAQKPRPTVLITLSLCLIIISSHQVRNLVTYKNPFYPIQTKYFTGPEAKYDANPTYNKLPYPIRPIINNLASASELDWVFRGVVPNYSLDMPRSQTQHGGLLESSAKDSLVRTGGTYGPYFLAIFILYLVRLIKLLRKVFSEKRFNKESFMFTSSSMYILFCSLMPQSHELRYYLSPLMIIALLLLYSISKSCKLQSKYIYVMPFFMISLLLNFAQPVYSTTKLGIGYAVEYPARDLPNLQKCISRIKSSKPHSQHMSSESFSCFLRRTINKS